MKYLWKSVSNMKLVAVVISRWEAWLRRKGEEENWILLYTHFLLFAFVWIIGQTHFSYIVLHMSVFPDMYSEESKMMYLFARHIVCIVSFSPHSNTRRLVCVYGVWEVRMLICDTFLFSLIYWGTSVWKKKRRWPWVTCHHAYWTSE